MKHRELPRLRAFLGYLIFLLVGIPTRGFMH
jgi:hypothetical protein